LFNMNGLRATSKTEQNRRGGKENVFLYGHMFPVCQGVADAHKGGEKKVGQKL